MRIIVICQHYYPTVFRISDICKELVSRGNDITVVTGPLNYHMGELYDGYRWGEKRDEVINDCYKLQVKAKYNGEYVKNISFAFDCNQKAFPFTLGINQFDFLDHSDFCEMIADITGQNKINGIVNICSRRPEQLAHSVKRFMQENNYDIKLEYRASPDRLYDYKGNMERQIKNTFH